MSFGLKTYLDRFPKVCQRKFDRKYNFRGLEKEFEPLRKAGRTLRVSDVRKIFDPVRTPFQRYWAQPGQKELDRRLRRQPVYLDLARVPSERARLVDRLLEVFHDIGVVSLVLRFTHPDQFGIFSTPIVNLLQIHRPTTVGLYLDFCGELREWQEHFEMPSVAETEMALWVYHQVVIAGSQDLETERARLEFEGDVWIERRRVAQAVTPFFQRHGPLELAQILAEQHWKEAGLIAGAEFERLVRAKARQEGFHKGDVPDLVERLAEKRCITWDDCGGLRKAWGVRNKSVHPDRKLSAEEVEAMIEAIMRICAFWDAD